MKNSNYQNWSKDDLIKEIEALKRTKKYGLVWEKDKIKEIFDYYINWDESEVKEVFQDAEKKFPILEEVKNKEIITSDNHDYNLLIDGDNYHSLAVLNFTHKNLIDVIYIDPPYNTGNKDFKYNDSWVDKEDSYRHSKWLSFMEKRLLLARRVLKEDGLIFISIDDNELYQLKLLCDQIYGDKNHIATLPTIMNLKGNQDQFGFAGTHEYTLVFAKNINKTKIGQFNINEEDLKSWEEDEVGLFKKGATLKATGEDSGREKRPKMFYPLLFKKGSIETITKNEYEKIYDKKSKEFDDDYLNSLKEKYEKLGFIFILPIINNNFARWRWGYSDSTINKLKTEVIPIIKKKNDVSLYKKQRPSLGDLPTKKPKTIFYKPEYSSGNGTAELRAFFGKKLFNNPKPLSLIKDLITLCPNKNALVLDFFAGSGTTGHAVLELNNEDDGNRKFILCTNNEENICTDVCYPRIEKVISGYTDNKNKTIKGLGGNLKYFKTAFVNSSQSDTNKLEIVKKSTEILCMKEGAFTSVIEKKEFKIFKDETHYLGIVFDVDYINEFIDKIKKIDEKINVYVFSLDQSVPEMEFSSVKEKVKLQPIPEAILQVYRKIFKDV